MMVKMKGNSTSPKMDFIKGLREVTNLSLKEAKVVSDIFITDDEFCAVPVSVLLRRIDEYIPLYNVPVCFGDIKHLVDVVDEEKKEPQEVQTIRTVLEQRLVGLIKAKQYNDADTILFELRHMNKIILDMAVSNV